LNTEDYNVLGNDLQYSHHHFKEIQRILLISWNPKIYFEYCK